MNLSCPVDKGKDCNIERGWGSRVESAVNRGVLDQPPDRLSFIEETEEGSLLEGIKGIRRAFERPNSVFPVQCGSMSRPDIMTSILPKDTSSSFDSRHPQQRALQLLWEPTRVIKEL